MRTIRNATAKLVDDAVTIVCGMIIVGGLFVTVGCGVVVVVGLIGAAWGLI